MKHINFFFHIYQPHNQLPEIVDQIVAESYEPLLRQISALPHLRCTLNINYSLVELLRPRFPALLDHIRQACEAGQLELTATGAYHPIFPLIPEREVAKQIALNTAGIRRDVLPTFAPRGVFPPEMAFDGNVAAIFKSLGFEWTLTDDSTLDFYGLEVPRTQIYSFDGLVVFLRSNFWTNRFADYRGQWTNGSDAAKELCQSLENWDNGKDGYLIIALDGETFGHHHRTLGEPFLADLFTALLANPSDVALSHLSDICRKFDHVPAFIPPGSWSMDRENIRSRDYFSWWRSNRNDVHRLQWEFTEFVLDRVRRADSPELGAAMDRALYSCQFWWASLWKFNPGEIYKGAFDTMQILQTAGELLGNYEEIREGEQLFRELVTEIENQQHPGEG
jgi:predicted glycosyl hydrolase (DUF1957 family)